MRSELYPDKDRRSTGVMRGGAELNDMVGDSSDLLSDQLF